MRRAVSRAWGLDLESIPICGFSFGRCTRIWLQRKVLHLSDPGCLLEEALPERGQAGVPPLFEGIEHPGIPSIRI